MNYNKLITRIALIEDNLHELKKTARKMAAIEAKDVAGDRLTDAEYNLINFHGDKLIADLVSVIRANLPE